MISRCLIVASATALVIASAGFGAVYGWHTGSHHGPLLGALSVLMALGLEGAKPFAIEGAMSALRSWSLGRALALAVLGTVAMFYSLTAELSLMATIRADSAAQRSHAGDAAAAAKARYAATQRELEALPLTRPGATIAADIERLKTTAKLASCNDPTAPGYGPVTRRVCGEIASLKAEAATSVQRERLQRALRDAERDLAGAPPATKADAAASALNSYLATVGVPSDPGTLSEWLSLVPVLALELGSALAVILAGGTAVRQSPARRSSIAVPGFALGRTDGHDHDEADQVPGTPAHVIEALTAPGISPLKAALVAHLRASGGTLRSGQRGLAKALGASTTELHRTIHALAAAGTIALSAAPSGTELRLLA